MFAKTGQILQIPRVHYYIHFRDYDSNFLKQQSNKSWTLFWGL